jgi:hypothetical protein
MRLARAALILVGSMTFGAGIACAQAAVGAAKEAPSAASSVREAMVQLVVAQEGFYATHGSYTTDLAALGLWGKTEKGAPRVWHRVLHAGGGGWTGHAQGINGMTGSCVVFIGKLADLASLPTTEVQHLKPTEEGEITCDS